MENQNNSCHLENEIRKVLLLRATNYLNNYVINKDEDFKRESFEIMVDLLLPHMSWTDSMSLNKDEVREVSLAVNQYCEDLQLVKEIYAFLLSVVNTIK